MENTWTKALADWEAHLELHPDFHAKSESDICEEPYSWQCPICNCQINAIGEDMPSYQDCNGNCLKCEFA